MIINKNSNTRKRLILLITIFLFGFLSLFVLNKVFINLVDKIDHKGKNLETRLAIGEFIAYDILEIRALFHELATTTTSQRSRDIVLDNIDETIETIKESLNILENGGTLKRFVALNISGHLNTIKTVKYEKGRSLEWSFELMNATNHANILRYSINRKTGEKKEMKDLPILPWFDVTYRF